MINFVHKIIDLFKTDETKFKKEIRARLEKDKYINLKTVNTKLPINSRIRLLQEIVKKRKIKGVYLSNHYYFFLMSEMDISNIKTKLKREGRIEIKDFLQKWNVDKKVIASLLNQFEMGIMGKREYYTISHLENSYYSKLRNVDEYELEKLEREYKDLSIEQINSIINNLIETKRLKGTIKSNSKYLSGSKFREVMSEYLEEVADRVIEISFSKISSELEIKKSEIETFLIEYVKKNPSKITIYPLDQKIIFKT